MRRCVRRSHVTRMSPPTRPEAPDLDEVPRAGSCGASPGFYADSLFLGQFSDRADGPLTPGPGFMSSAASYPPASVPVVDRDWLARRNESSARVRSEALPGI